MEEIKKLIKEKANENGLILSSGQIDCFYKYMQNLLDWNERINLTAISDEKDIVVKHFIDSIVINKEIEKGDLLDLGSGAGFPGIPLKIVNNVLKITLLDAVNKKVNFMKDTIEKLELKDIVAIHARAEDLARDENYREAFDFVVSRAVANLTTLVEYMLPFTKVGGKCLCLKGPNVMAELSEARNAINVLGGRVEQIKTYRIENNERSLVIISKLKCTEQIYPRRQGKPLKEPIR